MNRTFAITASALIVTAGAIGLAAVGGDNPVGVTTDVHHPECEGLVKDIAPGAATPIAGVVYVKAGPHHFNVGFQGAGYVAGPQDGHDVSHVDVCPEPETSTIVVQSTSTGLPTTTTVPALTTTVPDSTTTSTTTSIVTSSVPVDSTTTTTSTTTTSSTTSSTQPTTTTTTATTEPPRRTTTTTRPTLPWTE